MADNENLDVINQIQEESKRLKSMEQALGFGLYMPFNNANSSPRKLMHGVQFQHSLQLLHPEPAMLSTGYEDELGNYSSNLIKAETDYEIIGRVNKFSFDSNRHYYLIVKNVKDNSYDVIERKQYDYITENYGLLMDNEYLDSLSKGDIIARGNPIKKSLSFDEYNNAQMGKNLTCMYTSEEYTKEDAIKISDVAAKELASPLIKFVPIVINDNDILLNLLGNANSYKSIPNIGEEVKNGILCALRRRKKEDSLFAESYYRLSEIMMSDEKYLTNGEVIDINIYCNNPDGFESYSDAQLKFYYDQSMRFSSEIVKMLAPIVETEKTSYDLQKLFYRNKSIVEGKEFIKEKKFSNIYLEIVLLEKRNVNVGDKLTNRYGGKGCVSIIKPQKEMPRLDNGRYVDVIYNSSGVYNRENVGQLIELSLNFIGQRIIDYSNIYGMDKILNAYTTFLHEVCPNEFNELHKYMEDLDNDELDMFMDSILEDGFRISLKPISETITIDDLNRIYKKMEDIGFPIKQYQVEVPIKDSNGNIRYIKTRRRMTAGYQYIYRLKQYAEEKFSSTSLSSTNIKGENSKSSSKKYYKSLYTSTPVRFGAMESGDLSHIGMETLIVNLMLVSVSPKGRRLVKRLFEDNPFVIDVTLDDEATNTGAEMLNTYLLTQGLKLNFIKRKKNMVNMFKPINMFNYVRGSSDFKTSMFNYINPNEVFDVKKYLDNIERIYGKDAMINMFKNVDMFKYNLKQPDEIYKLLERLGKNNENK